MEYARSSLPDDIITKVQESEVVVHRKAAQFIETIIEHPFIPVTEALSECGIATISKDKAGARLINDSSEILLSLTPPLTIYNLYIGKDIRERHPRLVVARYQGMANFIGLPNYLPHETVMNNAIRPEIKENVLRVGCLARGRDEVDAITPVFSNSENILLRLLAGSRKYSLRILGASGNNGVISEYPQSVLGNMTHGLTIAELTRALGVKMGAMRIRDMSILRNFIGVTNGKLDEVYSGLKITTKAFGDKRNKDILIQLVKTEELENK